MKLYFSEYEEHALNLSSWKEYAKENNIKEMELFEAEVDYNTGYFWCDIFWEIGESGEGCGKMCEKYIPRNGKNGRCRFHKNTYSQTDKIKLLKL